MDPNAVRLQLIADICQLPADKLPLMADYLRYLSAHDPLSLSGGSPETTHTQSEKQWPHAPLHRLSEHGTYMVTTATYLKAHVFRDPERLDLLENMLLSLANKYDWQLEAWAIFSNHYHFIGYAQSTPTQLSEFLTELHANTAREVNRLDNEAGRQVWHNYWDKRLTFEKSYLARLNYVHQNAVKHGLVRVANEYRWCSAAWFERVAKPAQVKTVYKFKTDQLKIADDFDPLPIG